MSASAPDLLFTVLERHHEEILRIWVEEQNRASVRRSNLISQTELEQQCREFLSILRNVAKEGARIPSDGRWQPVRDFLSSVSRSRALQGFTPGETATFVFSLKQALFKVLEREAGGPQELATEIWRATELLDQFGLFTVEQFQRSREEVIRRQQQEILELSTPVVKLWDGIVAVPLIGTLDSARTQVVMENLLQRIVDTGASIAIIDITGVPTVDTLVAQHLIKTVAAARLMGADCIISGIRPQIAQTIVHLGINLEEVSTKASLADAIALSFSRLGITIHRS